LVGEVIGWFPGVLSTAFNQNPAARIGNVYRFGIGVEWDAA
jgi:hypothetical protein